jgi:hypothetical protein
MGVKMAKPAFRLSVRVDKDTWEDLLEAERFSGIEAEDFFIETNEPTIWLRFVAEDRETVHRLRKTAKAGGLPMKWAGERLESTELFNSYFRAAVEAAKADKRVQGLGPDESPAQNVELETAKNELENARARFEAALKSDARGVAELHDDVPQVSGQGGDDE